MLILKCGLRESMYWFASEIFVSKWMCELSNLGSTITSS